VVLVVERGTRKGGVAMDRDRFDALARLLAATGSRRRTLGALLGIAVFGEGVDALAKKNGTGSKNRSKNRNQKKRRQKERRARDQAAPANCFTGSPCIPGPGTNLASCDFEGTNALAGQNLRGSNLSKANLQDADASGAKLNSANLGGACLVDANLTGATTGSANFTGAIFCRTKMPNGTINNSGCNKGTRCCPTCINFGEVCGPGIGGSCCNSFVCEGGTCRCPLGQTRCPDGVCRECCENGQQSTCPANEICCAGDCANLQTDPNNCCRCGRRCDAGEICSSGLTCQDPTCLPLTRTSGDVVCADNGGLRFNALAPTVFGAARIEVPPGTTFGDLASMSSDFEYLNGTDCGAGSPRFVVFLTNGRCPYGVFPPATCGTPNASGNTGEMIGNNTPFEWLDDLCGGSGATTFSAINTLYQNVTIDRIALVVDDSQGDGGETVILNPCVTIDPA
jgi:hypothetical protein